VITGWEINETLFSSLKEDESFYTQPDKLRHPLIFYITHPAVFYINKLREVRRQTRSSLAFVKVSVACASALTLTEKRH
jgi:hypothetical protein